MNMLLTGNLLSAVASVFLGLSCVINDKKKAYHCQALESAILMISSVFFGAWVRMITLAPTVLRNELVAFDKYKKSYTVIFTIIAVISGLLVNREGPMGLFPIALAVKRARKAVFNGSTPFEIQMIKRGPVRTDGSSFWARFSGGCVSDSERIK